MKSGKKDYHPIIYGYLKKYQEDPTSRVFAPLAEAYRKAGLIDEALEIAREGLRIHPNFIGGKVALGRALFDKKEFTQVIDQLSSVIQDAPDNLLAQRLVAESCLMLGRTSEALSAYKMLLYFSPQDGETAQIVQELEGQAYENGTLVLRTGVPPADPDSQFSQFQERVVHNAIDEDPDAKRNHWIQQVELLQSLLQRVERYRRALS